jgi:MFS family permease
MSPHEGRRLRRTLYAAAFLRALAIGQMAVLIGLYAARLGLGAQQIGVILSCALWGAALAALITLMAGARVHERTILVSLCALPVLGAAIFLAADDFKVLAAAAFVGMFNVHGRDRGAIPIVEQAIFPRNRKRCAAHQGLRLVQRAARCRLRGGRLAGRPSRVAGSVRLRDAGSDARLARALLRAVRGSGHPLRAVAEEHERRRARDARAVVAQEPADRHEDLDSLLHRCLRRRLHRLGAARLLLRERFGVPAAQVAVLFAVGRVLSAFSHLAAAWLAKRIGLINTMVFTHIPTSLLLFTIVATDDFFWAAFFFLLREAMNEMDVPTRQSYVMAVVEPQERLAASGITNLVRSCGWAMAPMLAGVMMTSGGLGLPLIAAGATKITYDLLLWREFRRVKPPEELEPA